MIFPKTRLTSAEIWQVISALVFCWHRTLPSATLLLCRSGPR